MKQRAVSWLGALALGFVLPAHAHDLITAESAQRYVEDASRHLATMRARGPAQQRAEANVALGRLLDEVRELLNRDLAVHGRVQGLPSNYVVAELQARGAPLHLDATGKRFLANLHYYREALQLSPNGPLAGEAMFRWLRGVFYDSFEDDPLAPASQSLGDLEEQIRLGERLVQRYPAHADLEETNFILLVYYVRAVGLGPDPAARRSYAGRARTTAAEFQSRYPDSLRTAAVPVLLSRLP